MELLFDYLLKSSVWTLLFASVYTIGLRNERFFGLNRLFLLTGIGASLLFPLYTFRYKSVATAVGTVSIPANLELRAEAVSTSYWQWFLYFLVAIYAVGVAVGMVHLLFQCIKMYRTIGTHPVQLHQGVKVIQLPGIAGSFSYFSYILINPSLSEQERREILNHELAHIRQHHRIDLMAAEFLCLVQWFNPVAWWYATLIRQNHEYLADAHALSQTRKPEVYRAVLLNQMAGSRVVALSHSFNYSLNVKRFQMMKNTVQSPFRKAKILLAIPFAALLFWAFAQPETTRSNASAALLQPQHVDTLQAKTNPLVLVDGKEIAYSEINAIQPHMILKIDVLKNENATGAYGEKGKNGVILITTKTADTQKTGSPRQNGTFDVVDQMPTFPGNEEALRNYLATSVKYPAEAASKKIEGKVYVSFVVNEQGSITNVSLARGAHALLDAEAMRVIRAMPNWNAGKHNGKAVPVNFTIPIQFNLE